MSEVSRLQAGNHVYIPDEKNEDGNVESEYEPLTYNGLDLHEILRRLRESEQAPGGAYHDATNGNGSFGQNAKVQGKPMLKPRGQQSYCTFRRDRLGPYSGCNCTCSSAHAERSPRDWSSSPAEIDEWDYELPNGGHPPRAVKVRFADPLVTEIQEFERWYCEEYVYGDRYWAKGFPRCSTDESTSQDDDADITWQVAHEKLAELEAEWARSEADDADIAWWDAHKQRLAEFEALSARSLLIREKFVDLGRQVEKSREEVERQQTSLARCVEIVAPRP